MGWLSVELLLELKNMGLAELIDHIVRELLQVNGHLVVFLNVL